MFNHATVLTQSRIFRFFNPCHWFQGREMGGMNLPVPSPDGDVLTDLSKALMRVCTNSEPRFLGIGEKLQAFYFEADALSRQTLDSVKLVSGEGSESVLEKVKGISRDALDELEDRQARVTGNLQNANSMVENLGGLFSVCSALDKISQSLRVVGVNIGIEGAKSEQSQEKFSGFSTDIKSLSEKISKIAESVHDDVSSAMVALKSTCGEIASGVNRLERLAQDAGDTVDGAVRRVAEITEILFETMENTGKSSREISQRVGDIVMAIQFHDNMRQRVEHIVHAFDEVQTLLKDPDAVGKIVRPTPGKKAEAFSVLKLQAAQLAQIISEITDIYQSVVQAFDDIRAHVDGLGAGLSSLDAREVDGIIKCEEAVRGPMDFLKTSLKALSSLLADGRGLINGMRGAAVHASDVAERVALHTSEVHGISIETHMMALNAIVKSAHLGNAGRVFEILAQEVKRLSDRAMQFAGDTEHSLALISSSTRALRDESSGGKARLAGEGEAKALLRTGFEEITSDYALFSENCLAVQNRSKQLKTDISGVMDGLSFLPELADALTRQLKEMEALMSAWEPLGTEKKELTQIEIDQLLKHYTMAQEREIHSEMMGGAVAGAAVGEMSGVTSESATEDMVLFDDDSEIISHESVKEEEVKLSLPESVVEKTENADFDDNIELFSDEEPVEKDASNNNVALFEDFSGDLKADSSKEDDKVQSHIPDVPKKEEDFGDNIELF